MNDHRHNYTSLARLIRSIKKRGNSISFLDKIKSNHRSSTGKINSLLQSEIQMERKRNKKKSPLSIQNVIRRIMNAKQAAQLDRDDSIKFIRSTLSSTITRLNDNYFPRTVFNSPKRAYTLAACLTTSHPHFPISGTASPNLSPQKTLCPIIRAFNNRTQ